jgi:ssDNA-binding Zn-finger/Zn-ribbon topoisomerase 1
MNNIKKAYGHWTVEIQCPECDYFLNDELELEYKKEYNENIVCPYCQKLFNAIIT